MDKITNEQILQSPVYRVFQDTSVPEAEKGRKLVDFLQTLSRPAPAPSAKQKVKSLVKSLPPVRLLLRRRYVKNFAVQVQCNMFHGVYPSFPAAVAAAPKTKGIGYDQPGPAALYRDHLDQLYPMDVPAALWMSTIFQQGARSVFDFGGHVGVAFHAFGKVLRFPEGLTWKIYDVPAVCEAGRKLAAELGAGKLSFTGNTDDGDGADLWYVAGSLQYSERTLPELFARLRTKPRHLLVTKLPLSDSPTCVTIQNIGVAFCPYRVANRAEFIASIRAEGYTLVHTWRTPDLLCDIPFQPAYGDIRYDGFYFRRDER